MTIELTVSRLVIFVMLYTHMHRAVADNVFIRA